MCFCGTCVGVGRGEGSHGVLPCGPLSLHPVSHLPLPLGAGGRGLLTLGPTSLWDRMMLGKCLGPCWLPGAGGIPRPSHVPDLLWSPPTSWHLSPALLYCGKGGGWFSAGGNEAARISWAGPSPRGGQPSPTYICSWAGQACPAGPGTSHV